MVFWFQTQASIDDQCITKIVAKVNSDTKNYYLATFAKAKPKSQIHSGVSHK